jgi:protein tyrosine phosphatase (PTP) superfamily phosphohydrolase (DUF442 family)
VRIYDLVKSKKLPSGPLVLLLLLPCVSSTIAGQTEQGGSPPRSQHSIPTQHSIGTRKNEVGVPNFGDVTPNLFRGGQPGVDGFKTLKEMGVGIVVDMRGGSNEQEKDAVTKLGMEYVSIPWHCTFPSDEPMARFLKLIEDNRDKKVFVHCRLGADRTGMAIAAYRMASEGWSADEALNEMAKFGFDWEHHMFCPTLERFEKSFPQRLSRDEAFEEFRRAKGHN